MALTIVGSGILLFGSTRLLGEGKQSAYFAFLCVIFSPLGIYLGYKSLAETTAIFLVSAAVFLFLVGIHNKEGYRYFALAGTSICLLAGSFSRAECIFGFLAFVVPVLLIRKKEWVNGVKDAFFVIALWIFLSIVLYLLSGLWAFQFFFNRSDAFAHNIIQDRTDYPPNFVSVLFFGGGMWGLALLGIIPPRRKAGQVALAGLILSIIPLLILLEHLEIRYLHPALLPFSLAAGLGMKRVGDAIVTRFSYRVSLGGAFAVLAVLVASNQLLRPFQEVGVNGIDLVRMVRNVQERHPDPLLVTLSVPNTYSFLRVVFPNLRVSGCPLKGMVMPIEISAPEDLFREDRPWVYISTQERTGDSLVAEFLRNIRKANHPSPSSGEERSRERYPFPERLVAEEVAREGRYVAYLLGPVTQ